MSQNGDLWPDLELPEIRTPHSILREQASYLARRTGGILEGRVEKHLWGPGFDKQMLHLQFVLVAPVLDGYQYTLFTLVHDPVVSYPVWEDGPDGAQLENEDELRKHLAEVFRSPQTTKVIQSLVAQSREPS
jgi:hypothetical protein